MIRELIWDTEFFNRKIGAIDKVTSDLELKELLAYATKQQFRYLVCRLMANEIASIQVLGKNNFYMTDIGVTWERDVEVESPRIPARVGTIEDIDTVKRVAKGIFKDGRFYQDPFFTKEEADRFYQVWAKNSLKGFADKVFLIEDKGFITCKISDNVGSIPLIGVSESYQGKGMGTALVLNAMKWFKERGINRVTVRTQAGNNKSMRFYEHLGFEVKTIDVTMGKILFPP